MRRQQVVAACFVLLSCLASGRAFCADDAAVRATSDAFVKAFDAGDAQAVAALWTKDGELVDADGRVYQGQPAIEAAYAEFFQQHPGAKIEVVVDSVRMLGSDAALEEGHASLDGAPAGAANYSAVHVKQNGQWRMASVYERDGASMEANPLDDLDWLVGNWTGEEYGATSDIACRWLPNRSFLERKFSVTTPDGQAVSGIQLIGVNQRTGNVESWNFNFDGGHAMATWAPKPGGWAISTESVRPDGVETHAVNLLTKLDDNAYSWQSVDRRIGGQPLPNTGEIILKRVVPTKPAEVKKK